MKKVIVLYMAAAVGALVTQTFARPAAPNFQTVLNKDGSSVTIRHYGDEHFHYAETSDGYLVMRDTAGNYVYVGEDGSPSGVLAKNEDERTDSEKSFLKGLDQEAALKNHEKLHGGRFPEDSTLTESSQVQKGTASNVAVMAYNQEGVSVALNRPSPQKWTVGERWFPVLLIGTPNKAYSDSAAYYDFLNKPGYNKDNHIGSLRDYFLFVSDSLFNPHFDVYPVNISSNLNDFGYGDDFNEGKLVAMGIDELVKREDFLKNAKKYCYSNSNIDGFIFLFPGMEEEATVISKDFWSHQFAMSVNGSARWFPSPYKAGGYSFEKYVFNAQMADESNNKKINKLGILAHEMSHVLGLKDHYSKDANGKQIDGPGIYDLMSLGMYNGTTVSEGNIPLGYSAFEKETVGWLTLEDLQPDSIYSLKKLSKMQAYSVTNPNHKDEYYVIEYRPAEKFDAYLPRYRGERQNGVYVWYIDYDKSAFEDYNNANGDVSHQRVAIKAILAAKEYYVDFTYVNKSGTTSVPGVYNFVLDGTDRACFTTSKSMALSACPEESSSSVASSSSEAESSSSEAYSNKEKSSSSEAVVESSSSENNDLPNLSSSEAMHIADAGVAVPQVRYTLEGRMLHVLADVPGLKSVRLFDMQGHLLYSEKFSGSAATLDLGNISRGAYVVRLTAGSFTSQRKLSCP